MEMNRTHLAILNRNIAQLRADGAICARLGQSPRDWSAFGNAKYDLVLCDPPYADNLMPIVLQALIEQNRLNPRALVSVELGAKDSISPPAAFSIVKERTYGHCKIVLLQFAS